MHAKRKPAGRPAMATDNDLIKLYSQRILALAADIPHRGRLEAPQASVRKRAPLCGSTVSVDLDVTDGRISRFGQDVKACALGQASAALLGRNVIGRTRAEVETARDQLKAMLAAGARRRARPSTATRCWNPRAHTATATPRSCWRWRPPPRPWQRPNARPAPDRVGGLNASPTLIAYACLPKTSARGGMPFSESGGAARPRRSSIRTAPINPVDPPAGPTEQVPERTAIGPGHGPGARGGWATASARSGFEIVDIAALLKLVDEQAMTSQAGPWPTCAAAHPRSSAR
jgi:NifU-like protein involved in Fe-S cluster formation